MATNINDLPYNTKTELPSRDIPRETLEHVADPQVTPNYIPPKAPEYIEHQPIHMENKLDRLIDEFKIPILVGILYFIFEMPTLSSSLVRFAPTIFTETTTGLLAKSACFGALYYGAMMMADYLSKP